EIVRLYDLTNGRQITPCRSEDAAHEKVPGIVHGLESGLREGHEGINTRAAEAGDEGMGQVDGQASRRDRRDGCAAWKDEKGDERRCREYEERSRRVHDRTSEFARRGGQNLRGQRAFRDARLMD